MLIGISRRRDEGTLHRILQVTDKYRHDEAGQEDVRSQGHPQPIQVCSGIGVMGRLIYIDAFLPMGSVMVLVWARKHFRDIL